MARGVALFRAGRERDGVHVCMLFTFSFFVPSERAAEISVN